MNKHKDIALETLINLTNARLGYAPTTPSEFNELASDIRKETGRTLSLSSIKRLWGYVRYEGFPSSTTLNTLAIYNGYTSWDSFFSEINRSNSDCESGFLTDSLINADTLKTGDRLQLSWNDDKMCEIECVGELRFRVIMSHNIKLLPGDLFTMHTVSLGHPIYLSNIVRDTLHIPAYYGARQGGLRHITYLPA